MRQESWRKNRKGKLNKQRINLRTDNDVFCQLGSWKVIFSFLLVRYRQPHYLRNDVLIPLLCNFISGFIFPCYLFTLTQHPWDFFRRNVKRKDCKTKDAVIKQISLKVRVEEKRGWNCGGKNKLHLENL